MNIVDIALYESQNTNGADFSLALEVRERLEHSEYWTSRTKANGKWISGITCPACGKPEAYAHSSSPLVIMCHRGNNCYSKTKTLQLFPDIITQIEERYPATEADPDAPARQYLISRGLSKSLKGLDFRYWKETRPGEGGAVMFPVSEEVFNGRLFNPKGKGKSHNKGRTTGLFWKHPALEYRMDEETFVTEGIIDALSIIDMGFQAISVLSAGQNPAGIDFSSIGKIVFAFDNNLAGWRALKNWKRFHPDAGAIMPEIGDWNDLLIVNHEDAGRLFKTKRGDYEKLCENIELKIEAEQLRLEIDKELDAINQDHAVVMVGGKCLIMREYIDPAFGRRDIAFSSVGDFRSYQENRRVQNPEGGRGKRKTTSYADIWMKSPKRRQYEGIVFNPGSDVPGYYNLWKGFCIEPKKGDWHLFENHIFNNIVNGDLEHFEWVMAWLARLVQAPGGERPGTAIVMKGKRGTGKGCFVSQFREIFGPHFLQINNQKMLTGRFNQHLKDALLVFCDEGFFAGSKSEEGVLKGLITEETHMIEPKGKDAFQVKNHVNLIMASNNDWVIPAGLEERRFFVTEVSSQHMQDRAYFKAIWGQMNNGGRAALLYDLLDMDISGKDLRTAPKTKALLRQIEESMTLVQQYWYQNLTQGENISGTGTWYSWLETARLYEDFIKFADTVGGRRFIPNLNAFIRSLKTSCPAISRQRGTDIDRKWGYFIPGLEHCREEFEQMINFKVDWDE